MKKIKILIVLIFSLIFLIEQSWAGTSVQPPASQVKVVGTELIVRKSIGYGLLDLPRPYVIKGVTWQPATKTPAKGVDPFRLPIKYSKDTSSGAYEVAEWCDPTGILRICKSFFGLGKKKEKKKEFPKTKYGFFLDSLGRPESIDVLNYWLRTEVVKHYKADIALMKQMNVNTVRVYIDFGGNSKTYKPILDEFYKNNIMVIMTVAISREDLERDRFDVYTDYDALFNHFYPTGFMGDAAVLQFDDQVTENPSSGLTCVKITYSAAPANKKTKTKGWAEIYWQSYPNNWGKSLGLNLRGFNKLVFKARGEKGGETIDKVIIGGIKHDTATIESAPISLTKNWQEYSINLTNQDLRNIRGGFCISFSAKSQGARTIYLDDIYYTYDPALGGSRRMAPYQGIVTLYKDHPAILMWSLGNEWNLNKYDSYSAVTEAAEVTNRAAQDIKAIDPNHPVSSCLGDRFSDLDDSDPNNTIGYIVRACPDVDIWGLNVYRGASFGELFIQWQQVSSKPFYISEFGTDSFNTVSYSVNDENQAYSCVGNDDQDMQAKFDIGLWDEIQKHLSVSTPGELCLGGLIREFNDELWKIGNYYAGLGGLVDYAGPDDKLGTKDDDHSYKEYNTEGFFMPGIHPDNVANEEYFGVVDANRKPKKVFSALKDYYAQF